MGFLGGPPIYTQRRGHPRLRMRHIPFAIDEKARQEWLRCFDKILDCAVERYHFPPQELPVFRNWLHVFSEWMINTK
ncbi:MAG: hypothetical protein O3A51_08375 [Verrucomicrobia bacterium]|nr:hypothetical protein [Verrucomicrobiota bacterium]